MNSIIPQNEERCYHCGRPLAERERHHLLHGSANRQNSEDYGLTVYLCPACHAHIHANEVFDLFYMQLGQTAFEELMERYEEPGPRERFRDIFGKSWL
jgi:hypothetical protein